MGDHPSIELLEAGHVFPGPYMFKVIGKTENGFVGRTVAAVRDALAAEVDPPYSVRETNGGRFEQDALASGERGEIDPFTR